MAKASRRGWVGSAGAALVLALGLLQAAPVLAQETPQQFDAVNAENRRHSAAQNQLRNQAHVLRTDRANTLLGCQGAGAAAGACANNANTTLQQRSLDLHNDALQERNTHSQVIQGLGVHQPQ